eukprot:CAMPEP_0174374704 /NCGR_PEP_ID=MMETSP0811_2-20130205/111866_1 /TAXON_ID=73025 ORGANISM="Eutreptiella gymnastica-like, Strain CCMP1594" /NCGR_SAMPLE_ID=MMETSP0811_2 /ASSEMBLY_ACC=CAM_ASM_000667 /LENGTH=77 /DNA_ID=CAMNT_0015524243 /DNA_START=53 /DNA_END=282 /DNA_ORIENTATION=-
MAAEHQAVIAEYQAEGWEVIFTDGSSEEYPGVAVETWQTSYRPMSSNPTVGQSSEQRWWPQGRAVQWLWRSFCSFLP